MVEVDLEWFTTIIAILIPLTVFGGFIWRGFIWLSKKQDDKARERIQIDEQLAERKRKEEEVKAEDLRKYTDRIASDLKDQTTRIATGLKEATEKLADDLKFNTASMAKDLRVVTEGVATDLKEHTKRTNEEMLRIVKDTNDKFVQRADLTNGNVSNIRKDILELSGDIEQLYSDIHSNGDGVVTPAALSVGNIRRRRKAKKRDRRLDQINIDRTAQDKPTADRLDQTGYVGG
jgi:excinuclease UvrABC nuclease subunit